MRLEMKVLVKNDEGFVDVILLYSSLHICKFRVLCVLI